MAAGTQPVVRAKAVRDPLDERVRRRTGSLDCIFSPASVVVIADSAAPDPAARTILSTISNSGFAGKLFAVGLDQTPSGLRVQSYPSVKAVPLEIDLAVVTTPAERLLEVLGQCSAVGVKGTIVTTSCRGREDPGAELCSGLQQGCAAAACECWGQTVRF